MLDSAIRQGESLIVRMGLNDGSMIPEHPFRVLHLMKFISPVAIILGQDPYSTRDTATGIAFANFKREGEYKNIPLSPSLEVIKESVYESGENGVFDETLSYWITQGIFPINVFWTVKEGQPMSHSGYWVNYTMEVLSNISSEYPNLFYVGFGRLAAAFQGSLTSYAQFDEEFHPAYYARSGHPMPPKVWCDLRNCVREQTGKDVFLTNSVKY